MTQFRWLVYRKPPVTADQVRAYAQNHECTLMDAKTALIGKQKEKVLQLLGEDGVWKDVPVVFR